MKVLIQWATATAQDWHEYDIRNNGDVRKLSKKKRPLGKQVIDDEPGWISAINIQGVIFDGVDHVGIQVVGDALVVTASQDDDSIPVEHRIAQQWTFHPPGPDPLLNGRTNTRQSVTWYADNHPILKEAKVPHLKMKDFIPGPEEQTLHGVWVDDDLWAKHVEVRSQRGWREWT